MNERRLVGHTTKNATLLSEYEDIRTAKEQLLQLRSYETIVVSVYSYCNKTIVYAEHTFDWSNTTIKHIGWFLREINSLLGLDLNYYDLKFMAIKENFKLVIEPGRVYYLSEQTNETITRDSKTMRYAANHSFDRREYGYYFMGQFMYY